MIVLKAKPQNMIFLEKQQLFQAISKFQAFMLV